MTEIYFLTVLEAEILDQGTTMVQLWCVLSSWLVDSHLPTVCAHVRGVRGRERDTETDRQTDRHREGETYTEIERVLCCLFFFFEGKYSYYFI